jgi:hypothetical protein
MSPADPVGTVHTTAVDPPVELLDRQVDFLLRQTDSAAFLVQVEPCLMAPRGEPQLVAYLDDVLDDVVDIVGAMEVVDAELTSELLELARARRASTPGR